MPKSYFAMKTIVLNKDRILLLKRKEVFMKNFWDIPGGRVGFGENPVKSLLREVREEAGISVKMVKPIRVWSFFKDKNTQVFGLTVLTETKDKKINLGDEHSDYKWVKPKDVKELDVGKGIFNDIREFMRTLE